MILYGISDFLWIPSKVSATDLAQLTAEPYGPRYPDVIGYLEEKGYI